MASINRGEVLAYLKYLGENVAPTDEVVLVHFDRVKGGVSMMSTFDSDPTSQRELVAILGQFRDAMVVDSAINRLREKAEEAAAQGESSLVLVPGSDSENRGSDDEDTDGR